MGKFDFKVIAKVKHQGFLHHLELLTVEKKLKELQFIPRVGDVLKGEGEDHWDVISDLDNNHREVKIHWDCFTIDKVNIDVFNETILIEAIDCKGHVLTDDYVHNKM